MLAKFCLFNTAFQFVLDDSELIYPTHRLYNELFEYFDVVLNTFIITYDFTLKNTNNNAFNLVY